MPTTDINFWMVLVGAIAYMLVGAVWYSPALFGKEWERLSGKAMGSAGSGYALSAVASLIVSFGLAYLIGITDLGGVHGSVELAASVWVFFVATTMAANAVFSAMPWRLYAINAGYPLAGFIVVAGLIGRWG